MSQLSCGQKNIPSKPFRGIVLLVEDDPVNREFCSQALKYFGCEVRVTDSGESAIEMFKDQGFDLILMDCEMPGIDGFMAAEKIRRIEKGAAVCVKRTPIVALTAHDLAGDREKCLASGMDDFLSKPFQLKDFTDILNKWIVKASLRDSDPSTSETRMLASVTRNTTFLDPKALNALKALEKSASCDLVRRMVHLFFEQVPKLMRTLYHAETQSDAETIRKASHSLKSASGSLGAVRLSELSKTLEQMASESKLFQVREHLREMEAEYRRVKNALEVELERIDS